MQKGRIYFLSLAISSFLSGCGAGGSGTTPTWTDLLYVEPMLFGAQRFGVTATNEGTSLYLGGSTQNSDVVSFRQYDSAGVKTGESTPDIPLMDRIVLSFDNRLVVQEDKYIPTSLNRPFQTEVAELDPKGETLWVRTVTPGMPIDPGNDNIAHVSMMLSYNDMTETDMTFLLTGLNDAGMVRWQTSVSAPYESYVHWQFDWGSDGTPCYIRPLQDKHVLVCLQRNGSESFSTDLPPASDYYSGLYVLKDKVVVASENSDGIHVSIYDKHGALLQQHEITALNALNHIAETSDGRVHLFFYERLDSSFKKFIVSLDEAGSRVDNALDIPRWDYKGDLQRPLPWDIYEARKSNVTNDDKGNLYFATYVGGEKSSGRYNYQTIQHVIMKLDAQNNLSAIVEGNWLGYNYTKNGVCSKICEKVAGLKNLQGMKMMPNGELITLWGTGVNYASTGGPFGDIVAPIVSTLSVERFDLE